MKKLFLVIFWLYSSSLFGQFVIVKDSLLNTPIKNATFSSHDLGLTTNEEGATDISIFNNDDLITISHLTYNSKKITKGEIDSIIYLTERANILPEIILTENMKIPLPEKYPLFSINPAGASALESSTANLLSNESSVTIQESQSGGGSPNYRGMEANRLLLAIDRISINNAIYRSGHVQNISSINPFFIESVRLLSGPASVAYGSGAMGGALIFSTKKPYNKNSIHFFQQFESSSNTVTANIQANYFRKNLSHLTAASIKSAGNLKMGKNRYHNYYTWGNEEYITNKNEQLYTNYQQANFIHKSNYRINPKINILLTTQYARSSNIYRFDKMNDIKNSNLKYKKWYYGPQISFIQSLNYISEQKTVAFDNINALIAFQDVKESRHKQKFEEDLLNNREENVKIYDLNIDFNKAMHNITFSYGLGSRNQKIYSTANLTNSDTLLYNTTRYPNGGSTVQDLFFYSQINLPINEKLDFLLGGRWNTHTLKAKFNNPAFNFKDLENRNRSFIKSVLLCYKPTKSTGLTASYYLGFRNPNVDDIGKVFSKDDVNIVVPNSNLKPEYANNLELTFNYTLKPVKIQIQIFNTQITNAINREYSSLNGADSIVYDGEMMRVQMNQNIESATISGANLSTSFLVYEKLLIAASCNYLKGRKNNNKPLAHIPPLNSKLSLNYQLKQHIFNFYTHYSAWKLAENYDEAGIDNLDEATASGNPSWYTLNISYSYKVDKNITFSFAIKNMLDFHYKTFGSGLSASGRNFILSLDSTF